MQPECLNHRLTHVERDFFNSNGYLIVENALDQSTNDQLIAAVNRIDRPTTFPKVWGILGWNIYLYHSHVDVTPPADAAALAWRVAWHQDSMRVNDEIETHPRPRLSLKIGYYLTDASQPDRGNTLVLPGSHLHDELDCPADGVSNPDGAEPVCVKPGSALILDRRT